MFEVPPLLSYWCTGVIPKKIMSNMHRKYKNFEVEYHIFAKQYGCSTALLPSKSEY